ncbi:MAG: hypothetical protein P4L55_08430 [Syntrophobacteraceae bacterium]|nr:hypothetical protein [Syntrophobacteraceae bacterium]
MNDCELKAGRHREAGSSDQDVLDYTLTRSPDEGVVKLTAISGMHKGQEALFIETPPILAYFFKSGD